ncbi:hypothetical protein BD311DRAFT_343678 [Dichomitus squalens]|uniref:Secreted protein n=1 Tax=Dichomitus squalens TaxID=114155 RepID=A0A4Q9N2I7_9APHY|nr:hypothetical protein BD311DRAFT_343678 [Dichomitus squalens]
MSHCILGWGVLSCALQSSGLCLQVYVRISCSRRSVRLSPCWAHEMLHRKLWLLRTSVSSRLAVRISGLELQAILQYLCNDIDISTSSPIHLC